MGGWVMKYSIYRYVDVAFGGPDKRNNVKDLTNLEIPEGKKDCYRTIFRFDERYKHHCEKTGSVSGFKGICYADWLPFDIDEKKLDLAYGKTKEAIELLRVNYDVDAVYLYFSGCKGFHILLPAELFGGFYPSQSLPACFKLMVKEMLEKYCDLSIYEINRLFRIEQTVNSKSGLYKIPLSMSEFSKGLDFIKELAKKPHKVEFPPYSDCVENEELRELYLKLKDVETDRDSSSHEEFWTAIDQGVVDGARDVTATRYAGLLKSKGMGKNDVFSILRGWNLMNKPPLEEGQLMKVIDSIFKRTDKQDEFEQHIFPIWGVFDEYGEFVRSNKKVLLGIDELDKKIRGVRPGQVLTFIGFTGNFKTATIHNILRDHACRSEEPVLLFELELSRLDLCERSGQMETGLSGEDIELVFRRSDEIEQREIIIQSVREKQENLYCVDAANLSFEDMRRYVEIAERRIYHRKTGLIGIDFLQLMNGRGQSNFQRMDEIAKGMKSFAKEVDVPLIVISQVTDVENESQEIKLMDVRDSKTIVQMSDYVVGLYVDKTKNQQVLKILKNRKGGLGKIYRPIDRKSMKFC
jgi:hypothetical protein